jgi:SAM-dependent methyltransferase
VALWTAIAPEISQTPEAIADSQRLTAIVAARATDSRTFFGQLHEGWDSVRRELFGDGFLLPTLLGLVDPVLVVADLGCGTGEAAAMLAPHIKHVIGVDREQMLDIAAQRTAAASNIDLRCGGLTDLPMKNASVDATLCMLVLHHIPDTAGVLAEIARVLRPGGRAVVLDMVAHNRNEYRATMGHAHQGFDVQKLSALAATNHLTTVRWTPLPAAPEAQGPPLFLAVFQRQ